MTDNRATGWKIPLFFCGVVLCIVGIASLFRASPPPPPGVPDALLREAKAVHIDLAADAEGKQWKARIAAAAGGFVAPSDKDARLGEIIRQACETGRFDAACTAAVLIRNDEIRDERLVRVARAAAATCAELPWGVLALHGLRDVQKQEETAALLAQRWETCHAGTE